MRERPDLVGRADLEVFAAAQVEGRAVVTENVRDFRPIAREWEICRVHVEPSGHPVDAEITTVDRQGQFSKKRVFFVRLNNGTRAIDDDRDRERYIAQRWSRA